MSTQRPVSSARAASTPRRLIAALILGAALGAGATALVNGGLSRNLVVVLRAKAPSGSFVASVTERPCADGRRCQQLHLDQAEMGPALEALEAQSASEIVWTPDGKRAGFLIDGRELWLYDAATRKLAGRVGLMTVDAAQSRLARGVTFSENGRAVTFDDCPRSHSGCRAGFVGVPQ
jgi:hypothetical protein